MIVSSEIHLDQNLGRGAANLVKLNINLLYKSYK
jgi:hypothetical protein